MKCHICDRPLDEPKFNPDIQQFDPCDVCMAVIEDTLAGFTEAPAAQEDAFGVDPVWEEMFPTTYSPFED